MFPLYFKSHFPFGSPFIVECTRALWSCRTTCPACLKSSWLLCYLVVPLELWWQRTTFSVLYRLWCLLPVTWRAIGRIRRSGCGAALCSALPCRSWRWLHKEQRSHKPAVLCVVHSGALHETPNFKRTMSAASQTNHKDLKFLVMCYVCACAISTFVGLAE